MNKYKEKHIGHFVPARFIIQKLRLSKKKCTAISTEIR